MDGQIEGTTLEAKSESRVRMNLSQNAKGLVQFEITAEFPSATEAADELALAINLVREVCTEKGLKLADSGAAA